MDERIEEVRSLLRRAFALLAQLDPPNVRDEVKHFETLALLTDHPKPGPVVNVSSDCQNCRIPEAPAEDE